MRESVQIQVSVKDYTLSLELATLFRTITRRIQRRKCMFNLGWMVGITFEGKPQM